MSTQRPSRSAGRKVVYAAITVLVFFFVLEAGASLALWLLGPGLAPLRVGFEAEKATIFEADPDLFWRLQPNLRRDRGDNPRMIDVRTNALSLRGVEISREKREGVIRVLAIGDSCTFGSGARTDETYSYRLEQRLREAYPQREIEVINAGVPGYATYQVLRFLELRGLDLAPDVVIVASGFNDAAEAVSTAKRSFTNAEVLSDSEYALALRPARRLALTRLAQRLRGTTGKRTETEPGIERQTSNDPAKMRVSFAEYRQNLTRIVEICRSRKILPVILVWPLASQAGLEIGSARAADVMTNQRAAREVGRGLGVAVVDLVPSLAGHPELFLDEVHLVPAGYAEVARLIAEELARRPPFDG